MKSKDVVGGHPSDSGDGKNTPPPLKGKSAAEVHAAHNKPGTPEPDQCKCDHCEQHRSGKPEKAE